MSQRIGISFTMPTHLLTRIFGECRRPAVRRVLFHPESIGIFFPSEGSPSPRTVLKFFDFATARVRDVTTLEKPGEWISASADGKFVLYH